LILFVMIEIDILASERGGGIVVDIIINHYWLGLIFLKITLYNFSIKFVCINGTKKLISFNELNFISIDEAILEIQHSNGIW
jgi:hypothetical protein